jgi:Holliday junction resolvase
MTPEGKIKKEIVKYLESIGAYVFCPVQSGRGKTALDIIACLRGRFVSIEVKVPGKYPTERQRLLAEKIIARGGVAMVAHSADDVRNIG